MTPDDIADALRECAALLPHTTSFVEAWEAQDFAEMGRQVWRIGQMRRALDTLPCDVEPYGR